MLTRLIEFSIGHRWIVIVVCLGIAAAGVVSFLRLPIDAFPDTTPVQVQVNVDVPALSPVEIEQQVTFPLEQEMGGLPGLREVRSISRFGLSQLTLLFEDGTDLYLARTLVAERMQRAQLPPGAPPPQLGPIATGIGEIYHYRLVGDGHSLKELRTIHDWVVRPQLRSVAGLAEVNAWGGQERQIQVVISPERLLRHNLSFEDVFDALEANNRNAGGGLLTGGESQLVQGVGVLTSLEEVGQVVVAVREGVPVRITDIATVVDGQAQRRGAVTAQGEGETVLGLAFMLMGENSHEVASRVRERMETISVSLPAGVRIEPLLDRTHLVEEVLHTVRENLFTGALLVVAVLFAFLGSLRAGLVVASAIPLSLLFAGNLMAEVGIAASLMSLGAIDFGLVIDSAVVLVENAQRRLTEAGPGVDRGRVVRDAAVEVRRPSLFGEMIILLVYLPVLALEGIEGKLFRPMVLTVVFAILGSMLFSVTLIPALSSLVLRPGKSERPTALVRLAQRLYSPILEFALRRRIWILGGAVVLVLAAGYAATRLGSVFVPRLSEGTIVINTVRATGVSLEESVRYSHRIERLLLAEFPQEIDRIWSRTGTAEVATDAMGIELTDIFMTLHPRSRWTRASNQEELVQEIEATLAVLPGMRTVYTQPIEMRMNEMVAGIRSDVGIKLFGDDLELLRSTAAEIAEVVATVPGAADVVVEQVTGQPVLEIRPLPEALGRHGVATERILEIVETLGGRPAGVLREEMRRFPIAVWLEEPYRSDLQSLAETPVRTASGGTVPLGDLAELRRYEGPATVSREWAKRRIVVQANARGRDVGSFVAEAQERVAREIELPPGYYLRWGGQFEHLLRARNRLLLVVPAALLVIMGMLYLTYGRWRDAVRIFTGVPFAAVGGVVALLLRDLPFSVSAAVGFVALSGVAVLDDMILVSFLRQEQGRGVPLEDAVRRAARTRLRPVLMTALVACLGFLPMAVNTGVGAEVQRPLATVVVGGIISSTLLTLVVLPALYMAFGRGGEIR